MKIIIGPDKLHGKVKKLAGFRGLNAGGVSRATAPWIRLQQVGLATVDAGERPYTGNIDLYINDGGLDHDKLNRHFKKIFREDVFPAIKEALPGMENKFFLSLHYNVDILNKITINDER